LEKSICPNCKEPATITRPDGLCSEWCYYETKEKAKPKPVVEVKIKKKRRKRNSKGELE